MQRRTFLQAVLAAGAAAVDALLLDRLAAAVTIPAPVVRTAPPPSWNPPWAIPWHIAADPARDKRVYLPLIERGEE